MKTLLAVLVLSSAGVAHAGETWKDLRGYFVHGTERGKTRIDFRGIAEDGGKESVSDRHFSEAQFASAVECMKKKATHAVHVLRRDKPVTDPNGVSTTYFEITRIDCVSAPGFYGAWKAAWR